MRDLTISVKGFSKVYNVQDFRVGYIHANPEVIRRVWRWHMLGGIDPSNIFMKTMAKALRRDMAGPLPPPWHEAYRREWDAVRRSSYEALREIPGVSLALPEAGTYHFVNISRLGSTDEVFTLLRDKYKVTVTPGTWYGPGGEGYLRLCYAANTPEVTEAGLERVAEALTKLAEAKGIN
jgi:aspartate/methionine/tyrosine aminotransferase